MKQKLSRTLSSMILAIAAVGLPAYQAHAVDGVIEINQARALRGGVTATDEPGFPVTLDSSGSYILTSNLDVSGNATAVQITADHVALNLNGFSMLGGDGASGDGVNSDRSSIAVHNGLIRDFGGVGLRLSGTKHRVEDIQVIFNGLDGIQVGTGSSVSRCTVTDNGAMGIVIGGRSQVRDCVISVNTMAGINATSGNVSLVVDNAITANGGAGILALSTTCAYARNVLQANNSFGDQVVGAVEVGTNYCNTNTTCP